MTTPQQQAHPLLDLEHSCSDQRRRRGPVTFSDDEGLRRRLERRDAERRRRDRRGNAGPTTAAQLEARELCHDLRQPLASSVVLAHMLEKEPGLSTAGRQQVELLHAELARLAGMLMTHLEPAAPVLVDVVAVVRGVCEAPVEPGAVPVDLVVEHTPLVLGEPVPLSRLVANLVANARGAAGPGGRVRVRVGASGPSARVAVEDSGDAVGAAPTAGFGLGLMIVDSVVKRHGGASSCSASELGGLQVAVTLPAALGVQAVGEPE